MPFTDPQATANPTTGLKATAAYLNTWRTYQDDLWGVKAGCRLVSNAATSITTPVALPFATETYDNNGCHDTASNTTRITCPSGWAGMWLFGGNVRATSLCTLTVYKNGSTTVPYMSGSTNSQANDAATSICGLIRLAVGDYIELWGAGTGVDTVDTATWPAVFWAEWWAL